MWKYWSNWYMYKHLFTYWLFCCAYFHTNALGERDTNSTFLCPQLWVKWQWRLGSLALDGNQPKRSKTLNSRLWKKTIANHSPLSFPRIRGNSQMLKKSDLWKVMITNILKGLGIFLNLNLNLNSYW